MSDDDVSYPGSAAAERDARDLLRARLDGRDQAAEAILARASLRNLAPLLAGIATALMQEYARLAGMPEADMPARLDELLRGVPVAARPDAQPAPADGETGLTASALILAVLNEDNQGANAVLGTCTHAEAVQVAVFVARVVAKSMPPDDRAEFRDMLTATLQAGRPLELGDDYPDG
jgi:hypothetical protein